MDVKILKMDDIHSDDSFNCRGKITPIDVVDLAKDIAERGLLQPIVVAEYDDAMQASTGKKWRLIAGFRRFMAFRVNGEKEIHCVIKKGMTELEAITANLSENIQRQNLNILQEAKAIKRLKDLGLTEVEAGKFLGMSRGWIQVRFMLLGLPEEVQQEAAAGILNQAQIRDLYTLFKKTGNLENLYEAVRKIKDGKIRGQKVKVNETTAEIKTQKRHRQRPEIFSMMEHIQGTIGNGLHTRCLAWAAGQISNGELYQDLKIYALENDKPYTEPI